MLPLRLSLDRLLDSRTPGPDGCFEHGFRLRIPGGPAVERHDPLLPAYGAAVTALIFGSEHEEALQSPDFDPGSPVQLAPEPFDPHEPEAVGVWDAASLRQAGTLPAGPARVMSAALEHGLESRAVVLAEERSATDDRREGLQLFVFSRALVEVELPSEVFERPARPSRPRLVLVADGTGDVRWWDPSATRGPLAADELPMSPELTRDLERLRDAFAAMRAADGDEPRGLDRLESDWEREALDEQAATLWRRARSELGRRYAVGFLGAGMRRPVWSPAELDDDSDGDVEVPF